MRRNVHVHTSPAIFNLGADTCTNEEVKLLLGSGVGLEVVLLNMVCDSCGRSLGVPDTRKA